MTDVTCKCNHLSAFSIAKGFKESKRTISSSNIGKTVAPDSYDIGTNPGGLILSLLFLVTYIVVGILMHKRDNQDSLDSNCDEFEEDNIERENELKGDFEFDYDKPEKVKK